MLINWLHTSDQDGELWFTSDSHLGHANIIKFCNRPFASAAAMDAALIDNWNQRVRPNDIVFHLGDFTLGDERRAEAYFQQLQGKIYCLANEWHHDHKWLRLYDGHRPPCKAQGGRGVIHSAAGHPVELLPPLTVLEIPWITRGGFPLAISLCHYPLAEWDRKHYGAWHLHGHSHGQHIADGCVLNAGVDSHEFAPINLAQVQTLMVAKGWTAV